MGRGLSLLQKTILQIGYRNRTSGATESVISWQGVDHKIKEQDVYSSEIFLAYFRFPVAENWRTTSGQSDLDRVRKYHSNHNFSKRAIGERRYAAARASLSRALARLRERGLINIFSGAIAHWTGAKLTDKGMAVAAEL